MKILVCPCSYKGTVSVLDLASVIAKVAAELGHEPVLAPFADGGDDTLACIKYATGGDYVYLNVLGPTGKLVRARYLKAGTVAVVELASASGIAHLAPGELDSLHSQTYGFGQVISRALMDGGTDLYLTVGGSASTDGGAGALMALGARLLDGSGRDIAPGGAALAGLQSIDLGDLLPKAAGKRFTIVSDVNSPLTGPEGAAYVFGPQKGATAAQVQLLDSALKHYAAVFGELTGQDKSSLPGAGSAGGTGYGLAMAFDAPIISGFDWLSAMLALESKISNADAIVVAEGCMDSQTFESGKAVGRLAAKARALGKKVLALPAITDGSDFKSLGVDKLTCSSRFARDGQADLAAIELAAKELLS